MRWIALTLLAATMACGQEGASRAGTALSVALDSAGDGTRVVLLGLSSEELRGLTSRAPAMTDSLWQELLTISVADSLGERVGTAVSGTYTVNDSAVTFGPRFPFDAGRDYLATVNARAMLRAEGTRQATRFALPAGDRTPRTYVRDLFPSSDTVPENLLRIYVEFSAPMSRVGGLDFISLRDEGGREVPAAFLPLEAEFWNAERTRYTAFLDPGRVKQGILPNEQMGRAILAGRRYSVVVDSTWRDANGVPLVSTFRRAYVVAKPDESVIALTQWRLNAPPSATRQVLRVAFPKPLDRGLLLRALGVETNAGRQVPGRVELARGEREWQFTPDDPWPRGAFRLLVLSILEDPSGNRIDRPFEVDVFDRVDRTPAPERHTIPFTVR